MVHSSYCYMFAVSIMQAGVTCTSYTSLHNTFEHEAIQNLNLKTIYVGVGPKNLLYNLTVYIVHIIFVASKCFS